MPPCSPSEFTVQKKVYSAEKSLQCRIADLREADCIVPIEWEDY